MLPDLIEFTGLTLLTFDTVDSVDRFETVDNVYKFDRLIYGFHRVDRVDKVAVIIRLTVDRVTDLTILT